MTRPLRIEYPDAWYHVMNRGRRGEEIFGRVMQQRNESDALQAVAVMQQGMVIDLDARLALSAARLSLESKLPMADSIVLATARASGATVWTQDADFKGVPEVQYRKKKP